MATRRVRPVQTPVSPTRKSERRKSATLKSREIVEDIAQRTSKRASATEKALVNLVSDSIRPSTEFDPVAATTRVTRSKTARAAKSTATATSTKKTSASTKKAPAPTEKGTHELTHDDHSLS
ncbi:MAG: hypothetical protein MMC33_000834 [Icmadophila ericetorum]|nr:hypothetical protein [Icmadophila ericetorum]